MDSSEHGDLRHKTVGAMSRTSVVVLIDRTVQIVFLAIIARLLSPEQISVVTACAASVALVGLVSAAGIPAALIQTVSLTPPIQAAARTILFLSVCISIVLVEIFAPAFAAWFRNPEVIDVLRFMAIVLAAPVFYAPALAQLSRDLRARDIALIDLVSNAAGVTFFTIPLGMAGFGYWSLAVGMVAQIALRTLLLCLFARRPLTFGKDLVAIRNLWRRSTGFMLNGLLVRTESDAPRWIIGRFLPQADLALFSRASSLMNYPSNLFYSIVDRVIFPAVSLVQTDVDRVRRGALDAVRLTAVIGIPLTATLFFLGGDIIRVVLGNKWEGAAAPFQILCLATYFRLANRLHWVILRALGRQYGLAVLQAVLLLLTVAGCMVGARDGLTGVAVSVACVTAVGYLASGVMALRAAGFSPKDWIASHANGLACGLLAVAVLWPVVVAGRAAAMSSILLVLTGSAAAFVAGAAAALLAPSVFLGTAGRAFVRSGFQALTRRR